MSIESHLSRKLDIRFVDARSIAVEARVNLGIEGYPDAQATEGILDEAMRLFESKPPADKNYMQQAQWALNAAKAPAEAASVSKKNGWLRHDTASQRSR